MANNNRDIKYYLPLYKAVLKGDLEGARGFWNLNPEAVTVRITLASETALHLTAYKDCNMQLVRELVQLMPLEALAMKNNKGNTALSLASIAGAIDAARVMVEKHDALTQIRNDDGLTPILLATQYGNEDVAWFLLQYTRDENPSPFQRQDGARLLNAAIASDFYDLASYLLRHYPRLATARDQCGESALHLLARKPFVRVREDRSSFLYFRPFSDLASYLLRHYPWLATARDQCGELASHLLARIPFVRVRECLSLFLSFSSFSDQRTNEEDQNKLKHAKIVGLQKCICEQIFTCNILEIIDFFAGSEILSTAAKFGNVDLIVECLQSYPDLMWMDTNKKNKSIFHIAVEHRQREVFNLIHEFKTHKNVLASQIDESKNNILHLAAKLAPYPQLHSVSSVALQMRQEMTWFKMVEEIVRPCDKELRNKDGITPQELFTKEHKTLAGEGEKWMKGMAQSCMVVATLITTVVFAAIFTVPGGTNNDTGLPIRLKSAHFIVFIVSDALALLSSSISLLIFLSILTSGYEEEDFLDILPIKMFFGLVTLYISIVAMMLTVSAAFFIVLGLRSAWLVIPYYLAYLLASIFLMLQMNLFREITGTGFFQRLGKYMYYYFKKLIC